MKSSVPKENIECSCRQWLRGHAIFDLSKNEQFRETVFVCLYEAPQVEYFHQNKLSKNLGTLSLSVSTCIIIDKNLISTSNLLHIENIKMSRIISYIWGNLETELRKNKMENEF